MSTSRPLNPMADIFVRYLLGSEGNKDLLLDFINAVFSHKGHQPVFSLEIRNPFNLRSMKQHKESVLDVKAQDNSGRWINVEVQVGHHLGFKHRTLYYWAKNYSGQLSRRKKYKDLKSTVCINLLDFVFFPSCFFIRKKIK